MPRKYLGTDHEVALTSQFSGTYVRSPVRDVTLITCMCSAKGKKVTFCVST
jgi:hypothetical protein